MDTASSLPHDAAMRSIEIVSDFVCPWCFLGHARLRRALAARPDLHVALSFSPFLLDPGIPPEGADLRERLRARFGAPPGAVFSRVEAAARADGIPLDFEKVRRWPSTLGAHAVVEAARARGTQPALAAAIYDAYFLEGADVGDPETLDRIAARHGLAAGEARAIATDDAQRRKARERCEAQVRRGVTGVPFFVLDGRSALTGAQDTATWARILDRVAPRSA